MKLLAIVGSVTALLALATAIIIASMFTGDGMLTSSTLAIITGLFAPTVLQLINLLKTDKIEDKTERTENHAERIDRTVNSHDYVPHKGLNGDRNS